MKSLSRLGGFLVDALTALVVVLAPAAVAFSAPPPPPPRHRPHRPGRLVEAMSKSWPHRHRLSCGRKTGRGNLYLSPAAAQDRAASMTRKLGYPIVAYHCTHCGNYHIGKPRNGRTSP